MSDHHPRSSFRIADDDGREHGPFNLASLTQWARLGRLTPDTRVWDPRVGRWRNAGDVPEIARVFGVAAPELESATERDAFVADQIIGRGYDLNLGGWLSNAWRFYWRNLRFLLAAYWGVHGVILLLTLLAFTPLLVCIVLALPSLKEPHALKEIPALVMTLVQMSPLLILLLMAVALFLSAPLLANLWLVILRRVGGLPVSAGQVFRRLSNSYGEVLKVYFAQVFLLLALTMPFKWLLPRLLSGSAWTPWLSALSWSLRTLIEIAILTAFMFALPLAAERGLRWRSAIRTSCGIVKQHWLGLIWFVLIANVPSILSDVPLLAGVKVVKNAALDMRVALYLIIGVFACLSVLLAPFAQTALVFAYEGIFGRRSRPPDTAR